MIVDSFDYIACYKGLHPNLDKAIDWLNSHTLDALENGKTITVSYTHLRAHET